MAGAHPASGDKALSRAYRARKGPRCPLPSATTLIRTPPTQGEGKGRGARLSAVRLAANAADDHRHDHGEGEAAELLRPARAGG